MEPYFTKEITKQKMETDSCIIRKPEINRLMDEISDAVELLSGAVVCLEGRLSVVMSPAPPSNKERPAELRTSKSPLSNQLHKQIGIIKESTAILDDIISRLEI